MTRKKVVKKKVEIVFDPQKRKEFLSGFRKRKNERRKRAKDELERNIKEERKRIRLEVKDGLKHMKKSFEPLRELTETDKANEEYEDDAVKVKIVELSTSDLAAQSHLLGENRASTDTEDSDEDAETTDEELRTDCIPGMDYDVNAKKSKRAKNVKSDNSESLNAERSSKTIKSNSAALQVKSKKELDRFKKNKTLKKLKNSKVFKIKARLEKKVNQKKAQRDKNNTIKSLPKNQRKKKKFEPSRYRKGRLVNKKTLRKQQRD